MPIHEIDLSDQGNRSPRYGSLILWFVLHTEQGHSDTALDLHEWMLGAGVSYHYVSSPGQVVDSVDTDYASWSVLDANSRTINWCFAGSFASFTREQWMARREEIDYLAKIIVQDARKYPSLDTKVLGKNYDAIAAGVPGVIDHSGITYGLGIGSHTDVGPNFPFDYLESQILRELNPEPAPPPVNMIDLEAQSAALWIGERLTEGENVTPGGEGRWVKFSNGYIYWHPSTGAHAIPLHLFEPWADLGYEAGALGYPIADHAVLPVEGAHKVGDVQAFERGVLYRKYGEPGFYVHGAIGEQWKRDGFENSKWGWPTSNEAALEDGGRVQEFEHGYIAWSPDGTLALTPQDGPDYTVTPATL